MRRRVLTSPWNSNAFRSLPLTGPTVARTLRRTDRDMDPTSCAARLVSLDVCLGWIASVASKLSCAGGGTDPGLVEAFVWDMPSQRRELSRVRAGSSFKVALVNNCRACLLIGLLSV